MFNRVVTKDNLYQRKGVKVGNKLCVMCETNEETVNPLFFQGNIIMRVWYLCALSGLI